MVIPEAKTSFELTASAAVCAGICQLSSVLVITDGTNPAKVMLYDKTGGVTDAMVSTATLAQGSTPANVASIAFEYCINGTMYAKAAVSAGTAPGNDVVAQNKFGACAFDIGADGTIDAIEAAANSTGYNTAALAVADIPAIAADHVRLGYVTVKKTDGTFTFGATDLADASTTTAYTSTTPATFNKVWESTVPGASMYGGRNWTFPVICKEGLHCSISGTGASAIVEYI